MHNIHGKACFGVLVSLFWLWLASGLADGADEDRHDAERPAGEASVVVHFESEPTGATVEIDGKSVCETPCSSVLVPGTYGVVMKRTGRTMREERVEVTSGTGPIRWVLGGAFGWLTVHSDPPGLDVKVNGEPVGKTPFDEREMAPGTYEVSVSDPQHHEAKERVEIKKGERERLELAPAPRQGTITVLAVDDAGGEVRCHVYVDGRRAGRSYESIDVLVGSHELFGRTRKLMWKGTVDVAEKQVVEVPAALRPIEEVRALEKCEDLEIRLPEKIGWPCDGDRCAETFKEVVAVVEDKYVERIEDFMPVEECVMYALASAFEEEGVTVDRKEDALLLSAGPSESPGGAPFRVEFSRLGRRAFVRNRMGLRVYLRERLPEAIPDNRYFFVSIVGLINALDHHSSFLSPDLFKELQVETKGSFAGLGIEITIRDGVLTIVSPLEGTPAFKVGLMAGDQIVEIEEESTAGISLIEAVKLLRGPRGTEVTITILREGMADPKKVTIVRDIINIESVRSRLLDDGCLYVRVIQFSEKTTKDLKKAVDRIGGTAKGGIKGIILDLRNNPGGLLDQAVGVSDLFLESGKIVYTESRLSSQRMEFWADSDRDDSGQPLVVLINGGSSSASEIVAGALKDHNRAIVVGSQTFGKASVQTILPLEDGSALRLTTAKYYTVSGREIEAKGIDPHIVIEEAIQEAGGKEAGEKEEEAEEPPDLQLEKAQEILKDWEVYRRKHLGT